MPPNVGKAKVVVPLYDSVYVHKDDITEEIEGVYSLLKIDPNNLAEEAQNQPLIFARIGFLAAEAKNERDFAKRRLELAEAECDHRIRREADAIGEKKPTETQIKNMVTVDDRIAELTEEWLDACRNADMLEVLRQSVKDRRDLVVELMRDARHEAGGYPGIPE